MFIRIILGLEGGEEEAKRSSGIPTTEQQKSLYQLCFFLFYFMVMGHELILGLFFNL